MSESSTVMIPFHVSALTNGARMRPQAIDQVGCLRPEVLGCESGSVRWLRRPEGWVRRGPRISVAKSSHPTANCSTAWGNSVLTNYPLLGGQQSEPTATRRRRRRALPRQRRPDGAHSPSERPVLPLRQASLCAGTSPVEQRPDPRVVIVLGILHDAGDEVRAALLVRHPLELLVAAGLGCHDTSSRPCRTRTRTRTPRKGFARTTPPLAELSGGRGGETQGPRDAEAHHDRRTGLIPRSHHDAGTRRDIGQRG